MTVARKNHQPTIESLEDRCVPTTARLSGGILDIISTARFSAITVSLAGSKLKVSGVHQTFQAGAVHEIVVIAEGSNDFIALDPRLTTPAFILCGFGNALVLGDAGNDTVFGGGHITFLGRGGHDVINGVPDWLPAVAPAAASPAPSPSGPSPGSTAFVFAAINLTPEEQLMLELINRARANPVAEASRDGIDLNEGLAPGTISAAAKQPLAPTQRCWRLLKATPRTC
jgi:hypothetical protein